MIVSSAIFVVGAVVTATAFGFYSLCVGRTIIGLAVGTSSLTVPLYISGMCQCVGRMDATTTTTTTKQQQQKAPRQQRDCLMSDTLTEQHGTELAPTRIRGMLVACNELSITVGIFVSFLFAFAVTPWRAWRLLFFMCAVPASIQFVRRCSVAYTERQLIASALVYADRLACSFYPRALAGC